MRQRVAVSASMVGAGVILGLVGARYVFVNSALSLIPWGLASVLIGVVAATRSRAMIGAALFGFALATSFMAFSYDGSKGWAAVVVPFCLLGLVGAGCAVILALAGRLARTAASR